MVSQAVKDYIDEHAFCSEYLFRDWESFLDLLYSEGGRISSILWWDYCSQSQLSESVGAGGYKDPKNGDFIFAETQFYEDNMETKSLNEIKEYIKQEIKNGFQYDGKYKSHDLVPSFYLKD